MTIEMTYAFAKGKDVVASEPPADGALRALVSRALPPETFIVSLGGS